MLLLSGMISLGLSLLLVSAQRNRCPSNEVWSFPVEGCNTCLPTPFCVTREEYGCNCKSGYTRGFFGVCIPRSLCPEAPSTGSTILPTTATMESTTTTMGPTTPTMESTTTTMEPTTTTMGSNTTTMGSNSTAT